MRVKEAVTHKLNTDNVLDVWMRAALQPGGDEISSRKLGRIIAIGGAIQGATMGGFALLNGGSGWYLVFSAIKVPLFLAITGFLTLPSLYVLYALFGLSDQFRDALRVLVNGQAAFAMILASLAPMTLVFYLSGATYRGALSFNLALFALAAVAAQQTMRFRFGRLLEKNERHSKLLMMGFGLWAFVAVQLAWNLRPFVGNPNATAEFFRPDAFTNAYMGILKLLTG